MEQSPRSVGEVVGKKSRYSRMCLVYNHLCKKAYVCICMYMYIYTYWTRLTKNSEETRMRADLGKNCYMTGGQGGVQITFIVYFSEFFVF